MRDEWEHELPESIKVRAASVLPNGGVVYEFDSEANAAWIKRDGIMQDFQKGLGVGAQVKPHHYKVVAQYVPVSFDPENAYDISTVENDNDIQHGNLVAARWIKPPEKRAPGQRVAFLLISFLTAQDANKAITKGLYIASKHVPVHRDQEVPQRCAKCHKYDPPHLVRDCKAIHETCAACASIHHKTAECAISNHDEFKCINCKARGHAAWEKSCPAYKQALQKLRARRPEISFRLLPLADDPYTWESIEGGESLFRADTGQRPARSGHPTQLSRSPHPTPSLQRESSPVSDMYAGARDDVDGEPLSPSQT
ncbi:hypothetical protein L227DRAFT_631148 [Lentinus tigrinus ALCF2SS1-6]|uniref:Zinc knuckle domain-containing protein n=2 Tax=Lentinus tigrinus TaxID=5365 RepID=A0A5C2SPZ8_9APHY|nr:hypothetical protein L227DRAFT_631148 [Lentinus tigrinus ALCF2SS1-6]